MNLGLSSTFSKLKWSCTSRFTQFYSVHTKQKDCVLHYYKKKVDAGLIRSDPHQAEIINELNKLGNNLIESKSKSFTWAQPQATPPQGLYMYGGVGTGKTMLMDIFVDAMALDRRRSRTHFNQFMLDVQQRLHAKRGAHNNSSSSAQSSGAASKETLMAAIVKDLLQNAAVMCFDEFQVLHIADAMLLQRLFGLIWEQGVVVVATSNRPPDDLYKGGLQRQLFLPFIAQLKQRCKVLKIRGDTDYRLTGDRLLHVYQSKQDKSERKRAIDEIWGKLTENRPGQSEVLQLYGRQLNVPCQVKGIARFSFHDLCDNPLGAEDYAKLSAAYHTVVIEDIPKMDISNANIARRFITLIDELYNHRVKLICSSEVGPEELFPITNMNDLGSEPLDCPANGATIRLGDEEIFAFNRVVSRLNEMQTKTYLESMHINHHVNSR